MASWISKGKEMLSRDDRNWIEDHFTKLRELIVENQIAIAVLKVKAGIFGIIGGMIPIIIMLCIYWLTR